MIRPAFRPLRPVVCREQRGHQGNPAGGFTGLDPRAFLPATDTCGRGTEMPPGACSGNTPQRRENQNGDLAGFYRTTYCKSCKNALRIAFVAFRPCGSS